MNNYRFLTDVVKFLFGSAIALSKSYLKNWEYSKKNPNL